MVAQDVLIFVGLLAVGLFALYQAIFNVKGNQYFEEYPAMKYLLIPVGIILVLMAVERIM